MSRSIRKPIITEGYGNPSKRKAKRLANRRARRADVANGKAYKKVSNSWDITDYKFRGNDEDKRK
jgi:hypothetical protein